MATYEVNNLTFTRDGDTYLIKIASKEVYYGISSTAAATQQKNVTINNLEKIEVGTQINITFTNAQTYNGKPTLKINNLAAATVNNGAVNMWQAGETVNFVYDGAYWLYIGSGVASTNKYGVTKLTNAVTNSSDTAITPAAVNELSEYLEGAIAQNVRGATSSANGAAGRVPAPAAGDQNKYLKGDGTWKALSADSDFSTLSSKINGVDTKVNRIDRDLASLNSEVDTINTEKAKLIYLAAGDITWDAIWAKINTLNNTETALLTCESTACDFLTNGIRSNKLYGTISRRNDTDFKLMCRLNGNEMILADLTGATSYLRPTYTEEEVIVTSQIKDSHSITDTGYVLDAKQGSTLYGYITERVVGQRITKDIAAAGNTKTITLDDGCCCFLIASMPGISRCWVGVCYTSSDGTVTFEKINSSSVIQAEVPANTTNKLKFTWTYSSASTLNILCIPYRGTKIPSF